MKQIVKGLIYSFLFLTATATPAVADETANEAKGAIRGRIIDNTKQTLPGASIYIEKLHTGVTSDVNGFYTFPNLDPGTYTVKVTYVGYSPVELKITIPEGKTLDKDVILNEGLELQEVVVGGAFQGQRRAINSQRSNLGITNVVSADQVGKFPDSNIGDALKRISGINVQYDQGEARFGQVRGTSADLSSVTINGNRVPSAEGETRSVQLDLIPADMIQTIEVNKVVTPDMDADAIGGSINLVTKNSPYKRTIAATAGTGYNWVSDKAALNLGFTYGDRFFNDKLGLMVSASYQNNPAGSDDVEMAYERNEDGEVVLDEYEVRQYYVTRERQSYSLALDWEINANHKIDFKGIFKAMAGCPVTVRLLDPPLHEFVPHDLKGQQEMADTMGVSLQYIQQRVEALCEHNPMLGHRGCRLGNTYPEITQMQTRAILGAALELKKEGVETHPEIMVPLTGILYEFKQQEEVIRAEAAQLFEEVGDSIDFKVGTMIEIPRAALTADRIASSAEFFSFGTNDLTQMTFGYSRDDIASFLPIYLEKKILKVDPFQVLDQNGVGQLVRMATEKGRAIRPDLKCGICGEHGGEPSSVKFCHKVGLNYVSCSPFRVPIARLAAAQAAIGG